MHGLLPSLRLSSQAFCSGTKSASGSSGELTDANGLFIVYSAYAVSLFGGPLVWAISYLPFHGVPSRWTPVRNDSFWTST